MRKCREEVGLSSWVVWGLKFLIFPNPPLKSTSFFTSFSTHLKNRFHLIHPFSDVTSCSIFFVQTACLSPAFFFLCYFANLFIGFFIPVMGRFGNSLLPELFVMPLALFISLLFVLLTVSF